MMSVVAYCLPDAKHNKKDFDRDFNRFIVKQDMLSIATNKAQAEGRLDEFLSYVDNQVAVNVVYGCDDKSRLSVAIESAYLAESVRAKLYGNDSFGDVAHAVYEKFEGKIIPEEFVGSAQYVNNFIKGSFGENNLVYALVRYYVAEQGYGLDKLVDDEFYPVRCFAAEHGYGLDKLINDEEIFVRGSVATQGYRLDKLINDESGFVRAYVARQGYGLDKLVDDGDSYVRAAVAEQGYGLDKLVHDDAVRVRDAVAKQGYGLDILIDDDNLDVRMTVAHQGYGLDKLINDDYWGVRAEIANQGYGLDKLIHDEEPKVRLLAYDALRAEEEQQKSNQQGKRRVLFVQDNYDDEIENSEFDFDV